MCPLVDHVIYGNVARAGTEIAASRLRPQGKARQGLSGHHRHLRQTAAKLKPNLSVFSAQPDVRLTTICDPACGWPGCQTRKWATSSFEP